MKAPRVDHSSWGDASVRTRAAAQRLLAAAKAFEPSLQVTLADIQSAVRKRRHPVGAPWARLLATSAATASLLAVMGGVALSRGWLARREPPAAPTLISVPAGATTRVERHGRFRMSLRGPGAVEVRGDEPSLRLDEGALQVESGDRVVTVQATGRSVEISPSSTVTLEIANPRALRVGRLAGAEPRIDGNPLSRGTPAGVTVAPSPSVTSADPMPGAATEANVVAASAAAVTPVKAPVAVPVPAREDPRVPSARAAVVSPRDHDSGVGESGQARAETKQIHDVLARLRTDKDPANALELLQAYDQRFPTGLWHDEAAVLRIECLLALGRTTEALDRFESLPQASVDASPRLRLTRGELRARHGRCEEALGDFGALLALPVGDVIEQRAARGQAACRRTPDKVDPHL